MRKKLFFALTVWFIMYSASAAVEKEPNQWFNFSADYWISTISADAEYEGDKFSLEDDLSMSPDKGMPVLSMAFEWSETGSVLLSHMFPSYSGKYAIDRDIKYGGVTFPSGTEVDYKMKMAFTDILYRGKISDFKEHSLYILFGVKIADLFLELEGVDAHPGVWRKVSEDVIAPVPLVGLRLLGDLPNKFSYELQARGLTLPVEQYEFNMIDAEIMFNYEINENFSASAGYRAFHVGADVDDFSLDASLGGFVLRGIYRY
jgi:hypothetical protein